MVLKTRTNGLDSGSNLTPQSQKLRICSLRTTFGGSMVQLAQKMLPLSESHSA